MVRPGGRGDERLQEEGEVDPAVSIERGYAHKKIKYYLGVAREPKEPGTERRTCVSQVTLTPTDISPPGG